jgi:PAS domain-containing protein
MIVDERDEFYFAMMSNTETGIWRVGLEEPLPLGLPAPAKLDYFSKSALITTCNLALARQYGYDSERALIGKPILSFVRSMDEPTRRGILAFLEPPCKVHNIESHEVDENGNRCWFLNDVVGKIEYDCLVSSWGMQKDITPLRKLHAKLFHAARLLTRRENEIFLRLATGHPSESYCSGTWYS